MGGYFTRLAARGSLAAAALRPAGRPGEVLAEPPAAPPTALGPSPTLSQPSPSANPPTTSPPPRPAAPARVDEAPLLPGPPVSLVTSRGPDVSSAPVILPASEPRPAAPRTPPADPLTQALATAFEWVASPTRAPGDAATTLPAAASFVPAAAPLVPTALPAASEARTTIVTTLAAAEPRPALLPPSATAPADPASPSGLHIGSIEIELVAAPTPPAQTPQPAAPRSPAAARPPLARAFVSSVGFRQG